MRRDGRRAAVAVYGGQVAHGQGELQGANGAVLGIAAMIGPGLFTQTFASFIGPETRWQLPGAPFFLAAVLLSIAWLIGLNVARPSQPTAAG